jgi:hypothetical protein
MKTVSLATFNELEPAQQLRERLQRAGIQAFIHDETKIERFVYMSDPLAAFHVRVTQPDYEKSLRLVEEWDRADGALKSAIRCPECHSSRIEYPQVTRKFLTPRLVSVLIAMKILPREFYCFDCQYTWPVTMRVEPPRDLLGWPTESKLWHPEKKQPAKQA